MSAGRSLLIVHSERVTGFESEREWASVLGANILKSEPGAHLRGRRVVLWSGTPSDSLFERDPRAWGPGAMDALNSWCDARRSDLERGGTRVVFRPHARHVLCDAQRCRTFLAQREGQPFGVLLDSVSMLEHEMLAKVEDHLRRFFELLGALAEGVLLADAKARPDSDRVDPVPVVAGSPMADLLSSLVRENVPAGAPLLVTGDDPAGQFAGLGLDR